MTTKAKNLGSCMNRIEYVFMMHMDIKRACACKEHKGYAYCLRVACVAETKF